MGQVLHVEKDNKELFIGQHSSVFASNRNLNYEINVMRRVGKRCDAVHITIDVEVMVLPPPNPTFD